MLQRSSTGEEIASSAAAVEHSRMQSHLLCSRSTGNAIAQGAGLSEASRTCCFSSTHLCSSSARMHSSSSNSSVAALLQIPRHADLAGLTHALVLRERMPLLAELQQSCNRAATEQQQLVSSVAASSARMHSSSCYSSVAVLSQLCCSSAAALQSAQ